MFDFNALLSKIVVYELVEVYTNDTYVHIRGTFQECFEVLTNVYGDANVKALTERGVTIRPVKKG